MTDNVALHPTFIEKYPWAQLPSIKARDPENHENTINLKISNAYIVGNLRKNYRTPIYQAWAHLAGKMPPVPNIGLLPDTAPKPTLTTLESAHACFQGVKRPHVDDMTGNGVFTYILKVPVTIRYDNTPPVSVPSTYRLDDDLIFAIYVKPQNALQFSDSSIWGTALRMELVEGDPSDALLPIGHDNRYEKRLW